ncbi:MAG: isoaspartyl peptidase/L-asparaginase [Nevskiaceae bacterium]|nr:MAG: isoaspartyl peptidase/L-asparaginase [Nevskiaceae bacterium]
MIRLALHGGAGDLALGAMDQPEHRAALLRIAEEGRRLLKDGADALDAVERMVVLLEECPLFNAGVGAVLNRDGLPELDAAIMDGRDRRCGAVAGVMRSRSPVRLARAAMERSPHVLFAGAGADQLNRDLGLETVTPEFFVTEERFHQLKEAHRKGVIVLDHDAAFGTVGAVARDARGHLAAATSTGGLTNKHPGRVGDTPLIGAGTWADDRSAAISCTGTGECFIRACFGHDVHARMHYAGESLSQACTAALTEVQRLGGRGGCIAIDRDGHLALPFNSRAMYRAWMDADGDIRTAIGA